MKYFIVYTYTRENNPFPLYGSKVIDTEHYEAEWSEFLDGQSYLIENLIAPSCEASQTIQIIYMSEIK